MGVFRRLLAAGALLLVLGALLPYSRLPARAEGGPINPQGDYNLNDLFDGDPGEPKRTYTIKVPYTRYWWLLSRWADNWVTCTFAVEHEGIPTADDVKAFCGPINYNQWLATTPCTTIYTNPSQCPGLYLHPSTVTHGERDTVINLPVPKVWLTLEGCELQSPTNRCTSLPNLVLTGEEPLPNEIIIGIQGVIDNQPFNCKGERCSIPLQPTGLEGTTIEFWADSSFGDTSAHFKAQMRLVPWGDFMNPEEKSTDEQIWFVDIMSDQWRGGKLASCSETWQVFPPVGGPPAWLTSPETPEELQTSIPYYLLAAMLIQNGEVDASACANGGIQSARVANACGVQAAKEKLVEWQNRFDAEILKVARETGVPAQVMKNIFSRESQFWPGIYRSLKEAGLGQLTTNGAEAALLWNPAFFQEFCPFVLEQAVCNLGYGNIGKAEQAMLRGALVRRVNAACADCPAGVDLSQARFSVRIFAESLLGNCEQVGRIIYNTTKSQPGKASSYEDLWKFTLVNYNAGPGCLSHAIQAANARRLPLSWTNVTSFLEPACLPAIDYVSDVSRTFRATLTPTPWIPFDPVLATPKPGTQPTEIPPTRTPTPTRTPNVTATPVPTYPTTLTPVPTILQ
ncbi:MAG TPA: hypothetical protein VIO61_08955 [Anaerolineaceae bacterium]